MPDCYLDRQGARAVKVGQGEPWGSAQPCTPLLTPHSPPVSHSRIPLGSQGQLFENPDALKEPQPRKVRVSWAGTLARTCFQAP